VDAREVGRRIRALRKAKGLTMREVAGLAGISQGQLSRLENGKQGLRSGTLARIAEALGVEPYVLYLPGPAEEEAARYPEVGGELARALAEPEFVTLMEAVARAYRGDPARFEAVRTVVLTVLGEE
jgi:transcriptional regulator with XRE-family HTH domain